MTRAVPCLTLMLLAARLPAAPDDRAAAAPPERFEDTAQVLSIEVPVTIVGRDGQPFRGLTADSFEVLDDGVAQAITGFEVIDLARTIDAPDELSSARRAADERRSSARRHFLLLFDLSFSTPTAIVKARLAARDFVLHSLHPSDLAAVATVSLEQGVRLVVTFTPDRAQLARGIDTLGLRAPGEMQALSIDPLKFMLAPPASAGIGGGSSGGSRSSLGSSDREDLVLEYLNVIGQQVDRTQKMFDRGRISAMSRTLGDMARSLDAVKGRKHVVLFSEGFDSRLLLGRETGTAEEETDQRNIAFGQIWQVDSDNRYGNTELQNDMSKMLEQFRRADCVIQAVDIGGLRARGDASGGGERRSGKEALFVMAEGTGGELFEDANDLRGQLDRVLIRNEVTYVLSFERSDWVADGSYHRLQVRVRPTSTTKLPVGARVAHRAGYYAPQPFKDLDPLEKSLLASDQIASAAPRRDIEIDVLTAPFRAGDGRAYVPVIIEIDGRSLLQDVAAERLAVEIFGYVSDARGEMRDFFSQVVGVDLKQQRATFERTGVKYYGHFDLLPGRHLIRVLVRNNDTGRTGVESVALDVPDYPGSLPFLLPPFFLEAPGRWLLVRERSAQLESRSVVYPFVVNGEPFVPAAKPELRPEEGARLCLVAYNLGASPPHLVATVRGADGQPVDGGSFQLLERTATGIAGVDKLLARFDVAALERGEYRLEVALTDSGSGIRRSTSIPFAVQ